MNYSLHPGQERVQHLLQTGSTLLDWEMRTGKTRAILHAFSQMQHQAEGRLDLVVVCNAGGKGSAAAWHQELEEMGLPLPVFRLYGKRRRYSLPDLGSYWPSYVPRIILLNWEIAADWLLELQAILAERPYILVTDEGHEHLSNGDSPRYQAIKALALLARQTWELTGTLYQDSALDIYHQLKLLGHPRNPYQFWSPQKFADRYCLTRPNPFRGRLTGEKYRSGRPQRTGGLDYFGLAEGAELEIRQRTPAIDSLLESEVRQIAIPERQFLWLDDGPGYRYGGDEHLERALQQLISRKIELTLSFLKQMKQRPIVVGGWHVEYTTKLYEEISHSSARVGLAREGARDQTLLDFMSGGLDILVANYRSIGKGFDLSKAHHAVYGEAYHDAALFSQLEARLRGPKQASDRVFHWYLLLAHSVDEHIWSLAWEKGKAIERWRQAGLRSGEEIQEVLT